MFCFIAGVFFCLVDCDSLVGTFSESLFLSPPGGHRSGSDSRILRSGVSGAPAGRSWFVEG